MLASQGRGARAAGGSSGPRMTGEGAGTQGTQARASQGARALAQQDLSGVWTAGRSGGGAADG